MALRPVSELGLQEVTDIAARKQAASAAARAEASRSRPVPERSIPTRPAPTPTVPEPRAAAPQRRRAVAAVGAPLLSGALGVAASYLAARAVLERRG